MSRSREHLERIALGYKRADVEAIKQGTFKLTADLRVSINSRFGDPRWSYIDQGNPRLKNISDRALIIDFAEMTLGTPEYSAKPFAPREALITAGIPKEMMDDVMVVAYFRSLFPELFVSNPKAKRIHPRTAVSDTIQFVRFLTLVYENGTQSDGTHLVRTLSDITLEDLQKAAQAYPYIWQMQPTLMLRVMAHPLIRRYLQNGGLRVTIRDIELLPWANRNRSQNKGKNPERKHTPIIPNPLFMFLSENARDYVGAFMRACSMPQVDVTAGDASEIQRDAGIPGPAEAMAGRWPNMRVMLDRYGNTGLATKKPQNRGKADWELLNAVCDGRASAFEDELFMIFVAAWIILLLYTGMRHSDARTIQKKCLVFENDHWLIMATHVKHQPTNAPMDYDRWLAIDIVQDACAVLDRLCDVRGKKYYFSAFTGDDKPINETGSVQYINMFLRRIDHKRGFTQSEDPKTDRDPEWGRLFGGNLSRDPAKIDWWLTVQQFRTSLAYQLAREQVSLPFISMQLKHLTLLEMFVNAELPKDVTLLYGNIGKNLLKEAAGQWAMEEALYERALDLYGEGRKFAGGGADDHEKRVNAYFRGARKSGPERERRIRFISRLGQPIVITANGICTLNRADLEQLKDIQEHPRACMGEMGCDPDCKNNVAPEFMIPAYKARLTYALKQIRMSDQAYNREHWEMQISRWSRLLKKLGVDADAIIRSFEEGGK